MNAANCGLRIADCGLGDPHQNPESAIRNPKSSSPRPAYTLVELMVVMTIMVILVATLLPVAKRILDNDRVRECSRQLSAYMTMAKTRAVQSGRPCGLLLILEPPLGASAAPTNAGPYTPSNPPLYTRQCTKMFMAEVPPTYAGSTQGARGRIRLSITPPIPPPAANIYEFYPLTLVIDNSAIPPVNEYRPDVAEMAYLYTLINPGEQFLVRFNHKGPWYVCQRGPIGTAAPLNDPSRFFYMQQTAMGTTTPMVVVAGVPTPNPTSGSHAPYPPGITDVSPPTPPGNPGYYYQIMRSPRPVGKPLELTGGTCIDMTYSGMGVSGNQFMLASTSLALMFTPSGGVTGIYGDGSAAQSPTGTLHFLLARTTKMNNPLGASTTHGRLAYEPAQSNLADATSLWLSVGRATGTVTTSENLPPTLTNISLPNLTYQHNRENGTTQTDILDSTNVSHMATFLGICRQAATGRQQMGGQ